MESGSSYPSLSLIQRNNTAVEMCSVLVSANPILILLNFVLLDFAGSIPETSSKASIYALACNPAGTVLATGSPEKV